MKTKENGKNIYKMLKAWREKVYVKPTLEIYLLESLQGQFSGFRFLILFLKTLKLGKFL